MARILHVTPYDESAWGYGGIPRAVGVLTRGLAARGHRLAICATDAADAASRLEGAAGCGRPGIDVHLFPNLSNALAYHAQLFLPRGLAAFLRRHASDFDVAHLHACHHLPGVIAARCLRRAGVPYVLTPNGTAPRIERRRWAKAVFDLTVGRRVLPGAARVVAASRAEVHQLDTLGVAAERIRQIPNAVEEPAANGPEAPQPQRFRHRFGLNDREPLVLYLGKLTPRKRVESVVEAFAGLERGTRLVIAGNDMGSGRSIRRRVRRLGLGDRTVMTGLLRGSERFDALAAATVVVYPSRHEIFGLVPLEALLCGTPVIVADDSGCGETISAIGGGRVVALRDGGALRAALGDFLATPQAARRSAAAAAVRVRERFASGPVCRAHEELYREVIAEAGRPGAPGAAGREAA